MNFKKTIAKSLVVAMALGMVPVANLQTAKAATAITFDGTTGVATATEAKFWAILKEDSIRGTATIDTKKYKVISVQDLVGEIDVYSALKGKAGIIAVGATATPDTTWKVLELKEADKFFKVQFIASAGAIKKGPSPTLDKTLGGEFGYLFATDGKTPVEYDLSTAENQEKVEVKLNDGSWKTFKDFFGVAGTVADDTKKVNAKLQAYGQSGSTLTFRLAGTNATWASKEVKVKVATQAKAPSVKIDPIKETTTIKKGMQYQVVAENAAADDTKWLTSDSKKGLTIAELKLANDLAKKQDVLVKTAADSKKIASKVLRISVGAPAAKIYATTDEFKTENTTIVANKLTVKPVLAYDITKGLILENKDTKAYEYALVTKGIDGYKWNTIKAAKNESSPSKATLKYSKEPKANTWISKVDANKNTVLMVREAGKKQDKNNQVVLGGVTSGAILGFKNIEQKFIFKSATPANSAVSTITVADGSTKAVITVATGTAATFTIKAEVKNAQNPKGGSPKLKAVAKLPSGVTIKAGKINPTDGTLDITINVSKSAFKEDTINATAKYNFRYEGSDADFEITFAKKTP